MWRLGGLYCGGSLSPQANQNDLVASVPLVLLSTKQTDRSALLVRF
jgi:hypothetical protein